MARAYVITVDQASTLERLYHNGAMSAADFDRRVLESLVERGLAIKHQNGHAVTFSISGQGRAIYKSL